VFLNERGGIIDDTVITKHASDAFYVVTNAGRRAEDLAWIVARLTEWNASERAKDGPVEHELLDGWGLLALQGTSYLICVLSGVSLDDLENRTNNRSCFG
jgi:aminomethyltransferase